MGRLSLRIALPIVAGLLFVMLCFLAARQSGIIEWGGWGSSSKDAIAWGTEPVDIGTPADVLLLAFNLPALIALLPLLPLTYWVESEFVLRGAWGLAAVGQWFLIGRYFDIRRGLLPVGQPSSPLWLKKSLLNITMAAGALSLGMVYIRSLATAAFGESEWLLASCSGDSHSSSLPGVGAHLPLGLAIISTSFVSRKSLSVNWRYKSRYRSFDRQSKRVIACTEPRDFARFVVGSLCRQDLLCFLKVDLLISCDCTLSALITASLTPSVIGNRPSQAICLRQLTLGLLGHYRSSEIR